MTPADRRSFLLSAARLPLAGGLLALAGCTGTSGPGTLFGDGKTVTSPPAGAGGNVMGAGGVRVAMILPNSAGGQSSALAQQIKNAADLALQDFPGSNIQIMVKDDGGTTEGGQAAASQAAAEGAQLIVGPLNAVAARGAAGPARQAGIPVVAFTTDTSVASRGVYLIGFLPSADVERIVAFAAQQGRRSFAALVPDDAYGSVAEAAFRQATAQADARVMGIERYRDSTEMQAKAAVIAKLGAQIDAVFVPDLAANAAQAVQAMSAAGLDTRKVKILGTGRWADPAALASPALAGGWYPGPDPVKIDGFRQRYRQAYGAEPASLAVLGYEAVFLAAGLVRNAGSNPFREDVLLSRNGFLGVTGLFRFRPDGTSERGLAVFEIAQGGAKVVGPAPKQFGSGT
ncbi:penicillin-binding protein activator [Prosthecomicrobium sp. N25]|uniref:penicillin-binding protein activator n=1 Tax=Prosthecomicrobium sp. N25 TaxID=3129254 RepID=UPI0030788C6E